MQVTSIKLGLSGVCDVVEFHADPENGIPLQNYAGLWRVIPIEYKKGHSKEVEFTVELRQSVTSTHTGACHTRPSTACAHRKV